MPQHPIVAESSELSEDDLRKRDLVKDLVQNQNNVIVEFAKQLVTVSFTAIGLVLALKEKWLGAAARPYQMLLLGAAIVLYLATGLIATLAASAQLYRVSLADYANVDSEIARVAKLRFRLTMIGVGLCGLATILIAFTAIVRV